VAFSHGQVVSDDAKAPGIEIGRPAETYRRVSMTSNFGKETVLMTDGQAVQLFWSRLESISVSVPSQLTCATIAM
jgi:hypothetical protein